MANLNQDSIAGLILLAFSLILAFYLTPTQVEMQGQVPAALSPRLFCYIMSGLLAVLSLALVVMSMRSGAKVVVETQQTSWEPLVRGLLCSAIAAVYIALSGVLGFFVSTALAMTVFLIYFGVRKWSGIVLFLVIILGFIYLLFIQGLKVVMPDALFF
jgi:hypothetical protein